MHRRPSSKNPSARIPLMVPYLLEELPVMLSGIVHEGIHYKTHMYPTSASKASAKAGLANDAFFLAHDIQTKSEFSKLYKDIIDCCPDGFQANNGTVILPINDDVGF